MGDGGSKVQGGERVVALEGEDDEGIGLNEWLLSYKVY